MSYELPGLARFRVNIFSQLGNYSIVLRKLETRKFPHALTLGLPPAFYRVANEKFGIVLITGATGSGKTTSLAAIINEINENSSVHIITLEDPMEYTHSTKMVHYKSARIG